MSAEMIPHRMLHVVWHELWPLLEPSVKRSEDNPLSELVAGRADLWGIYENGTPIAAVVTAKQSDGRCLLWQVGGSRLREWAADFMAVLEEIARANGCTAIWGCGRRGWSRIVPQFGGVPIADHKGEPAWERRLHG